MQIIYIPTTTLLYDFYREDFYIKTSYPWHYNVTDWWFQSGSVSSHNHSPYSVTEFNITNLLYI